MKRLAVITTSLLLTLFSFGGAYALADEGAKSQTVYPQDKFVRTLEFENLSDYEIEGNAYYFLDEDTCYMYEDGEKSEVEKVQFSEPKYTVDVGEGENRFTYRLDGSTLKVWGENDEIVPFEGEFSLLKKFGDSVYAVKENELYIIVGTSVEKVVLNYLDYTVTETISVGQTATALKETRPLTFVNIKKGTYITEIDLTSLDKEYFKLDYSKQKAIDKENGLTDDEINKKKYTTPDATHLVEEETCALLLCYSGNAAIVATGDTEDGTSYILLNDETAIEEIPLEKIAEEHISEPEFTKATVIGNRIYSSPFTVSGTMILDNAGGTIVTVKSKLQFEEVLNLTYYEVEFTSEDGTVITGYIAEGFLDIMQIPDNTPPQTIPDPDYSEETNVTAVLLILAVVILVLVGVGYLIFTATSGKKKAAKEAAASEDEKEDDKK